MEQGREQGCAADVRPYVASGSVPWQQQPDGGLGAGYGDTSGPTRGRTRPMFNDLGRLLQVRVTLDLWDIPQLSQERCWEGENALSGSTDETAWGPHGHRGGSCIAATTHSREVWGPICRDPQGELLSVHPHGVHCST